MNFSAISIKQTYSPFGYISLFFHVPVQKISCNSIAVYFKEFFKLIEPPLNIFKSYWKARKKLDSSADFLFLNTRQRRLTEAAFRKRLRVLSESLSIEQNITPHRFRHTTATLLLEEGVDIRIIQRLLGHSSIITTEMYTKVADNSLIKAMKHADILTKIES